MADDNAPQAGETTSSGQYEITPLALLNIICSQGEAIKLLSLKLRGNLENWRQVVDNSNFDTCMNYLYVMGQQFSCEQLYIFRRLAELAECDEQLEILEDYLQKLPEDVIGYAMREWEKACDRVMNGGGEEGDASEAEASDTAGEAEEKTAPPVPPKPEEPPPTSSFAA